MHLVDDIHALFNGNGGEHSLLPKLTHIVNAVVRRSVDLHNVKHTAVVDAEAGGAFAAGIAVNGSLTVERLGKYFRAGGLARSAGADEQVRVGQTPCDYLISQGLGDMLLADDLVKGLWPPFAVLCVVHGRSSFVGL